jgi:hypothetical protein
VENAAAVVPLICYGEIMQLQNAVTWQWLQRLTYKWIGASSLASLPGLAKE